MVRRTWPARQGRNPLAGVDGRLAESTVPYDEVLVRSALCNKLVFLCFIVSIAERHPRDNYMLVRQIEHFPYRPTIFRPRLLRACFETVGPCKWHNVRHYEIGRASCGERVCQSGEVSVGAVLLKKKKK